MQHRASHTCIHEPRFYRTTQRCKQNLQPVHGAIRAITCNGVAYRICRTFQQNSSGFFTHATHAYTHYLPTESAVLMNFSLAAIISLISLPVCDRQTLHCRSNPVSSIGLPFPTPLHLGIHPLHSAWLCSCRPFPSS